MNCDVQMRTAGTPEPRDPVRQRSKSSADEWPVRALYDVRARYVEYIDLNE